MSRLSEFCSLPRNLRLQLLRSLSVVGFVRVGLLVVKVSTLSRALNKAARWQESLHPAVRTKDLLWTIRASGRVVPGALCLPQCLAAQFLLAQRGIATEVRIGVVRRDRQLAAHAWLESCEGSVCFDPGDQGRYTALQPMGRTSDHLTTSRPLAEETHTRSTRK